MNSAFNLRGTAVLLGVLAASSGFSQNAPAIPFSLDPSFWGRANKPYILTLTVTSTRVEGSGVPQTRVSEENVFRDSTGRVRTENFYDSGGPSFVSIRDPGKDTFTGMGIVGKTAFTMILPRPSIPPPGKGWAVERLPSRVVDGFPAEGFRFTMTVPASDDGKRVADTVTEEDWVSKELDVVLEQKIESQVTGTTIRTVSHFKQVEPDRALFTIPSDYTLQKNAASVSP